MSRKRAAHASMMNWTTNSHDEFNDDEFSSNRVPFAPLPSNCKKASRGKSNGPDCEAERLIVAAVSETFEDMNSINQDWVSWRDSSGNLVMAEKQRTSGSCAQVEINDASASGAQDESDEDDFVTITGHHVQALQHAHALHVRVFFRRLFQ
jgi:hypothetical protein